LVGLVFVQTITFFSAAYLILRAMLERLDPSMEEAAESMGANRFHIFRTVTLPLLIPGLPGRSCCSSSNRWPIWAIRCSSPATSASLPPKFPRRRGRIRLPESLNPGAGAADSHPHRLPAATLLRDAALLHLRDRQAHRRSRRRKGAVDSLPFIIATYLFCALIVLLYLAIVYSSFCQTWGVDFSLTLEWWQLMLTRGIEAVLDTTFLSLLATPLPCSSG
jgi:iron(III) transport system permease protein